LKKPDKQPPEIGEKTPREIEKTEREPWKRTEKKTPLGEKKSTENEKPERGRWKKGTRDRSMSEGRSPGGDDIFTRDSKSKKLEDKEKEQPVEVNVESSPDKSTDNEEQSPKDVNPKDIPNINDETDWDDISQNVQQKVDTGEKAEALVKITYVDEEGYTVTETIETIHTYEVLNVIGDESRKFFGKDGEVIFPEEFSEEFIDSGCQKTTIKTIDGWEDESVHVCDLTRHSKVLHRHRNCRGVDI